MTHLYFNLAYKELEDRILDSLELEVKPLAFIWGSLDLVCDLFCGAMLLVATQSAVLTKTGRKPLCLATKLWTCVALVVLTDTTDLVTDCILFGHKAELWPLFICYTKHLIVCF